MNVNADLSGNAKGASSAVFFFAFECEFSAHLPLQDNIFYLGSIHCTSNSVNGKAN